MRTFKCFWSFLLAAALLLPCFVLNGCGNANPSEDASTASSNVTACPTTTAEQVSPYGTATPIEAVELYLDYEAELDAASIPKLAPQAYWDYVMDEFGLTVDDVVKYYISSWYEYELEDVIDECDSPVQATFIVNEEEYLSAEDLDTMNWLLDRPYRVNMPDATEGVCLKGVFSIENENGPVELEEDDREGWLYALKIDGRWYPVEGAPNKYVDVYFYPDSLVMSAYYAK